MRYFIGLVLIIFVFLLGVALIFGHHGNKTANPATPAVLPLPQYANTEATVSLTIGGVITGDDTYREIKITVSRDHRELDIIQGYSGNIISSNVTYNSVDAYNVFLHALDLSGFTKSHKLKSSSDPTGQCPLGNRYIYSLNQGDQTLSSLWNTNCSSSLGNFGGNSPQVIQLFQNQITNYGTLTQNVDLSGSSS